MKEIKLPENSCPLCGLSNIESNPYDFNNIRFYKCKNCGPFYIYYMAYRFTPIVNNAEVRAKLSYFIHYNSTEDEPITIDSNNYKEYLERTELPNVLQQMDIFLRWFGEKSELSFTTVDGNSRILLAHLGCKEINQIAQLLDELINDKYIEMENPQKLPLRDHPLLLTFAAHLTQKGIKKITEFNETRLPNLELNEIIKVDESQFQEVKGSFSLDINRLLKGDGKIIKEDRLAKEGVLKSIVGFLNSKGGYILIGALEKERYKNSDLKAHRYKETKNRYILGIGYENENTDNYELKIRDMIASNIAKDIGELIEISFPIFEDITLCLIKVNAPKQNWYYLDDNKFYVREGNRTIELQGTTADIYKNRNKR